MLGSFSVGDQCNIGANSVVLKEVPSNSTVVGIPGRIVKQDGRRVDRLSQQLPDPVVDSLRSMQKELERLQKEVRTLQNARENETVRDT
ncbi:Serine acetyltransferase [compost metagenome]